MSLLKGTAAGLLGTVAMTAVQAAEMRASGREPSTVPGQVASKLLGLQPESDNELLRISSRMHWAHGATQGVVRSLLGRMGLEGQPAAAVHFILMWGGDAALYRALGIAPWPWHWSAVELVTDAGHKGLYALTTGAVYDRLS